LVDGHNLSVVGEHDCSKDGRCHWLHSIHVATSEQDVVIEQGVNNLNLDKDGFSPEFNGAILKEPSEEDGRPS
jgi:hypothetical protein